MIASPHAATAGPRLATPPLSRIIVSDRGSDQHLDGATLDLEHFLVGVEPAASAVGGALAESVYDRTR